MREPATSAARIVVLGSGSSGNAVAVCEGPRTLLVDAGFSAREMVRRMRMAGIDPASVVGLLLSHEHSDHVRGVEVYARRHGVEVYATHGTIRSARLAEQVVALEAVSAGADVAIDGFRVLPFATSHDAAEPVGFRIETPGGTTVGIATDTGVATEETAEALCGCELIGIESNHDEEMLETGPYPYFLKRRIASVRGHLSNAAASALLSRCASERLRHVVALHRSRTNNTAALAGRALEERIAALGLGATVTVAGQFEPTLTEPAAEPLQLF